jgi:hypothetical protein
MVSKENNAMSWRILAVVVVSILWIIGFLATEWYKAAEDAASDYHDAYVQYGDNK